MNLQECLEKGLIRKASPSKEKAVNSISLAEHKLELSQSEFDAGIFEGSFISSYSAMFHVARALLFKDGFKENSHYALYIYLKEKYGSKLEMKYITELNSLRSIRHSVLYGNPEDATPRVVLEVEAESALKTAADFITAVKTLLGPIKKIS